MDYAKKFEVHLGAGVLIHSVRRITAMSVEGFYARGSQASIAESQKLEINGKMRQAL